jgi:TonB family protein
MAGKADHGGLHSELAQLCLPATYRDRNQKLAWINSSCLAYLMIGVVGLKPPAPVVRTVQPLEMPVIAPLETPPPPPPAEDQKEEVVDTPPDPTDAPAMVAVVLDSPSVVFSVPTVGNVLLSSSMAQAPPLKPMQAPVQQPTNRILRLSLSGRGGNFPQPDYPPQFQQARMTGTIVLLISVDAAGVITDIEVEKSTGHSRLDTHTVNHVRRRFTFPAADGPRVYRLPVGYEL